MCVKLLLEYLNSSLYSPHPTNTYVCRVIIVPRVRGGQAFEKKDLDFNRNTKKEGF